MSALKLSIVMLTCNQRELTKRCLASLRPTLDAHPDYELILVDNGSTDRTDAMLPEVAPDARLIRLERNLGVAAGRNRGIDAVRGEYVMLLDNDTIVAPGAIEALIAKMEADPGIGLCAPRLKLLSGQTQESFKAYPGLGVKLRNVMGRRGHLTAEPEADVEPDYVIGACQLFRRSLCTMIGGLDERIFYGPEDADFCIRVRRAGLRVVYTPSVTIIHDARRATTRRLFSPLARKHIAALIYFYIKHRRFI